jgi:hypothetical protein
MGQWADATLWIQQSGHRRFCCLSIGAGVAELLLELCHLDAHSRARSGHDELHADQGQAVPHHVVAA